jgi:plasmid stability protein
MRNITVSVPEDVYRAARIRAAEKGTSVSALVTEHLTSLAHGNAEFQRLADQQRRIIGEITRFRGADRVDRADLHDRALR